MNEPAVVAIVPVYNRAQTVLPTLESIAAQSLPPRRLIVVDDGSQDGSAESVERWIDGRRPPCDTVVIRKPNGGVSSARNCAIDAAPDARWFAFLDSDDQWPADFLARAAAALTAEPTAVAASADRMYLDEATGQERRFDLAELAESPALWMLRWGAAICSCSVVRADLVRELAGFPEDLSTGEDAALFLPLSLRGKWLHLPGDAVRFVRRSPKISGEEASLSRKFTDNQRRWARVYDAFFSRIRARDRQRIGLRKQIRKIMSDRWKRAAIELEQHGDLLAAAACYARSVRWRPGKWERWRPLVHLPWRMWNAPRRAA
jgi:glycosyltransferase involved in cell wall biosynthesis